MDWKRELKSVQHKICHIKRRYIHLKRKISESLLHDTLAVDIFLFLRSLLSQLRRLQALVSQYNPTKLQTGSFLMVSAV